MSDSATIECVPNFNNMSRQDKKSIKTFIELGLKPMADVSKVLLNGKAIGACCVQAPIVFEIPGNKPSYVIIGEVVVDNEQKVMQRLMFEQYLKSMADAQAKNTATEPVKATVGVDETETDGCKPEDIELVMQNSGKSRSEAIAALKNNNQDPVGAVLELSE